MTDLKSDSAANLYLLNWIIKSHILVVNICNAGSSFFEQMNYKLQFRFLFDFFYIVLEKIIKYFLS